MEAGNKISNGDIGVSVIICCYNSAARLPQTLKHLAEQNVPENLLLEIILVNNASTDDTVAVATEAWNRFETKNIKFKIVNEPEPGQMHARKKGAEEARYECIIFCDDDNWLDKNYVSLSKQLTEKDSLFGAGGGQNAPVTDAVEYPDWFDVFKDKYAIGIPAPASGDVSEKGFVLGAGLVTKRSLFLQVNDKKYPSLLNGRDGQKLSTGDDFEYCKRLILWGHKLYYDENMRLNHFIPKERLTISYREKLMQGISEAGVILKEYDLAMRFYKRNKNKNKWRLFILAPFRILFSRLGWSKRVAIDEQNTFFYSAPFQFANDPVRASIKKFINHK
jgi:glycosyltransferase involved in cell wall biosynthesis